MSENIDHDPSELELSVRSKPHRPILPPIVVTPSNLIGGDVSADKVSVELRKRKQDEDIQSSPNQPPAGRAVGPTGDAAAPESLKKASGSDHATRSRAERRESAIAWATAPLGFSMHGQHVTDIFLTTYGEKPPQDRILVRCLSDAATLGLSRNVQIWIERNPMKMPLTALTVFFPSKGEFVPSHFQLARTTKAAGEVFLGGGSGARAFLAFCQGDGMPIIDVGICSITQIPYNWTGIERSPLGFKALIGQRMTRAISANSTLNSGGAILCVRYDLSEVSRFRSDDGLRYGHSEGEQSTPPQGALRKSSIIGQVLNTVTPHVIPLRKAVLSRRSTFNSQSGDSSPSTLRKRASEPSSPIQNPREAESEDRFENNPASTTFSTRLQRARERALQKTGMEEGLGMTKLAFDPEVAGLLMTGESSEQFSTAINTVVKGNILDALLAMRELCDAVRRRTLLPSVPYSEQMTMFDFAIAYGASVAVERGDDILLAPSCRLVVEGAAEAICGLHPVTLHHSLLVIARSRDFFGRVKDDFLARKAQALMHESFMLRDSSSPPMFPSTSNTPGSDPAGFADRPDTLVSRLSGFGFGASPSPQPPTVTYISGSMQGGEAAFHFLFPAETPDQMLNDRAFVLVQAANTFFTGLVTRCQAFMRTEDGKIEAGQCNLNDVLDQMGDILGVGPLNVEQSLEVYLSLLKGLEAASPLLDLLFSIIWLSAWTLSSARTDSSILQELLAKASVLESSVVGLVVRRVVFPMVFRRLNDALTLSEGIADSMQMLTVCWMHHRIHLKAEMAVALRSFVIPCLRSARAGLKLRLMILELLNEWLESSRTSLIEIYINLERDSPVPNWPVFQELFDALCLATRPVAISKANGGATVRKRVVMSSSASFISHRGSSSAEVPDEDDAALLEKLSNCAASTLVMWMRQLVNLTGTARLTSFSRDESTDENLSPATSLVNDARESLNRALELARTQGSAKAAVNFLVASGHLQETPQAVSQFLRIHLHELGESSVGDYLGEGGKTSTEQAFMVALRDTYIKASPRIATDTLDQALRRFLTLGGFRLPGEGQKVERLLEAFARRFCADHRDLEATEEGVLVLAFSLVMLNTDLHKPQIKQKEKMKKEAFIRNLSGVNNGKDFAHDLLSALYDSIAKHEIRFPKSASSASLGAGSFLGDPESDNGGGSSHGEGEDSSESGQSGKSFVEDLQMSLERGMSIANTLLGRTFGYQVVISRQVARSAFECITAKLFLLMSSILEDDASRFELIASALDLLEYAISIALLLDFKGSERRAFVTLLAKLALIHGVEWANVDRKNREALLARNEHLTIPWFVQLIEFESNNADQDLGALISLVHEVSVRVADRIVAQHQEQTLRALSIRLGYSELVSTNAERRFIREGILRMKHKDRLFLLFSDCLLRVEGLPNQRYKVEENLPLRTLRVVVAEQHESDLLFEIRSPLSTVVVQAASKRERDSWMYDINKALMKFMDTNTSQEELRSPTTRSAAIVGASKHPQAMKTSAASLPFTIDTIRTSSTVRDRHREVLSPITVPDHVKGRVVFNDAPDREKFSMALKKGREMLVDERMDTATKLLIYGYFKQATKGDCISDDNVIRNDVDRAKWHAWRAHQGMTKEEARECFVKVVEHEETKARIKSVSKTEKV